MFMLSGILSSFATMAQHPALVANMAPRTESINELAETEMVYSDKTNIIQLK